LDPDHPANDGLHPTAIEGYFKPLLRFQDELRIESFKLQIENVSLLLQGHRLLSGQRWLVNEDRDRAIRRDEIDETFGLPTELAKEYYPDQVPKDL